MSTPRPRRGHLRIKAHISISSAPRLGILTRSRHTARHPHTLPLHLRQGLLDT